MKLKLLTTFLLFACSHIIMAADGDTFTDYTVEGVLMKFQVISEQEKTCRVGEKISDTGNSSAISSFTEGKVTIPRTVYGYTVTAINNIAFSGSNITQISIPNSITSIGASAFEGCEKLSSILIPSSVGSIGESAFEGCTSLTSIYIPDGVSTIENRVFAGCSNLASITLPNSVIGFGWRAFENCSKLPSITIPKNVTTIGHEAFYGCSALTSITIPSSVSSIIDNPFAYCTNLNNIIVSDYNSVYDSRGNCNAIIETSSNTLISGCKNTAIPNGVSRLGSAAFAGCTALPSITIPYSVSCIDEYVFDGCSNLTSVTIENPTPIPFTYNSDDTFNCANTTLYVPIGSKSAYQDADHWEDFKEIIEKIIEPSSTTFVLNAGTLSSLIPSYQFERFTELTIKGTINAKDFSVIKQMGNLTQLNIENSTIVAYSGNEGPVTGQTSYEEGEIPAYLFQGNTNLESVKLPLNSIIGNYAFDGCTSLRTLTCQNIISLGDFCFRRTNLTSSINLRGPNYYDSFYEENRDNNCYKLFHHIGLNPLFGVDMGYYATGVYNDTEYFDYYGDGSLDYNKYDLVNYTVISYNQNYCGVTDKEKKKLYAITTTENNQLNLPNTITTLANYAISGSRLSSINLGSVTTIGDGFLYQCPNLNSIKCDNSQYKAVDGVLYSADMQTLVKYPCASNANEYVIPSSVTQISKWAFEGASNLSTLKIEAHTPPSLGEMVFEGVTIDQVTLYVPYGTKDVYEAAPVWTDFKEIIEMEAPNPAITFADDAVKAICLTNWNTDDNDQELSMAEAAAVTDLGEVFKGNEEITSFDELQYFTGLTSIGDFAFNGCSNLSSITIPDNVTKIGKWAFMDCPGLTSFTIPSSVTTIDYGAFTRCNGLTAITIPSNVTEIDDCAFHTCTNLTSVTVEWEEPLAVPGGTFWGINYNNVILFVPDGTKTAYRVADVWMKFLIDGDDRETHNALNLLQELIARMEAIGGYELDDAKSIANQEDATKDDLEEAIAQLQQQIKNRCTNAEESELPVEATGLITNPSFSFDTASYWSGDTPQFQSFNNAEFFETIFDFNQELTGLPNGNYLLKVKGFHRPGLYSDVYSDFQQGTDNASAQLYANGKSVVLNNMVSFAKNEQIDDWCGVEVSHDGTTQYVPNTMEDAYMWFSNGDYENELPVTVTDGTLHLGIHLDESVEGGWVIFDDFRLEYLGKNIENADLVENGDMEGESSEEWSYFWAHEWRTMEEQFKGPVNIVEDPTDADNHCAKVVVRSEAEADDAGNKSVDEDGNFALWDTQFFVQTKKKIESGNHLKLTLRVRAEKPADIKFEAHNMPGDYNYWGLFSDISVTNDWQWVVKEVIITPDMTQERNGKEMHAVAFHLTTRSDGNVFYFDDIKLEMTEDQVILPWGVNEPWQAKYVNEDANAAEDANGNPWYAVDYDDSEWDTLKGPIERSNSNWFSQSFFDWEPECSPIYMRRTFTLDKIPEGNIIIKAIVDDNMQVYLNGEKIPCISLEDFNKIYPVPQSAMRVGDNVLALLATDEGGEARCDYGIFVADKLSYYIDEQGVAYRFETVDGEGGERCIVYGLAMDHATEIAIADEVLGMPVTNIRTDAFYGSDLTAVTIPASVTEIGEAAFLYCNALNSITVEWEEPLAVPDIFDGRTYNEATLHVPDGTEDAYMSADIWKYFFIDGDYFTLKLLRELIDNMEAIGGYELDDAKAVVNGVGVSQEDLENSIAQLQQQIKDRCANADESELPVDATGLITNPSFSFNNNLFWQGDTPQFQTWNNAEFYETTFDIYQELTNLPNGIYVLKVKGYHRPGYNEDVYSDFQQDTNNASAQLYANNESVVLSNQAAFAQDEMLEWCGVKVSHDGTTQYVPDGMHDAYMWFNHGYYENELPVTVTDCTLRLGIRLDESVDHGWVIFDDFRLEYLGESDRFYVDATEGPVTINQGKTANVSFNLDNENTMIAFKFTLKLPDGISIKTNKEGEFECVLNSDRADGHVVEVRPAENGCYHFLCNHEENNAFIGNMGELLNIRLICDKNVEIGSYQAQIYNIELTNKNLTPVNLSDQEFDIQVNHLLMGDVNNDGSIGVTDLTVMIAYMMGEELEDGKFNFEASDINNDNKIGIKDVVEEVDLIFEAMNNAGNNSTSNASNIQSNGLSLNTANDGTINIHLTDNTQYIASQFIVTLSDGQVLADVTTDNEHDIQVEQLSSNRYSVISYSMDNSAFNSNDHTMTLRVVGQGNVTLEEPTFVDTLKNTVTFNDVNTETTGITGTNYLKAPTDIYSTNGVIVRKNATSTEGLSRGVYIVNGKKHSKK